MNFLVCDLSIIARPHLTGAAVDRFISYEDPECDANWDSPIHPPVSWHGYAAAMNGRFVCAPADDWIEHIEWADCILALWNYDPDAATRIVNAMKKGGKKIIGAFHENGDTFQSHAKDINWLIDFKKCANACNAILTYPRDKVYRDIYKAIGIKSELLYIPQPYYTTKREQYIILPDKRKGIFVAPKKKDRELERRNWVYNMLMAVDLVGKKFAGCKVFNRITTINESSVSNQELKSQLEKLFKNRQFEVISALRYDEYIKMLATHQVTINLDSSDTQGQVDADSMFVDVPLYQPLNFDYRTDFGDMYHTLMKSGKSSNETIQTIMTQISTFANVKQTITDWYNSVS